MYGGRYGVISSQSIVDLHLFLYLFQSVFFKGIFGYSIQTLVYNCFHHSEFPDSHVTACQWPHIIQNEEHSNTDLAALCSKVW